MNLTHSRRILVRGWRGGLPAFDAAVFCVDTAFDPTSPQKSTDEVLLDLPFETHFHERMPRRLKYSLAIEIAPIKSYDFFALRVQFQTRRFCSGSLFLFFLEWLLWDTAITLYIVAESRTETRKAREKLGSVFFCFFLGHPRSVHEMGRLVVQTC